MAKIAAGFMIYRQSRTGIEYLLLRHSYGEKHWSPPKGHVDPGENEFQTAQRETAEEAGLKPTDYRVVENFKKTLNYLVGGKQKTVIYWLAELLDGNTPIILSHEHIDYRWGNLIETKKLSGFEDMNQCYEDAENFLNKN